MNAGRDYSIVNIYLGDDQDAATESTQVPLDFVPRVGDVVDFWTSRDAHGNYINEGKPAFENAMRNPIRGRVTRVVHTIEERGRSSADHLWVQHVDVYLEAA